MNEKYSSDELLQMGKEYAMGSKRFVKDLKKSVECFRKSSDMGNMTALFRLALAYFEGEGVERNRCYANDIVKPSIAYAMEMTDAVRKQTLADAYSFGLGVKQDLKKAFELYTEAAEAGDAEAQCSLGFSYYYGLGTEKNMKKAATWWEKSANAGFPHSCCDMGLCYLNAIGVDKDENNAVKWFIKASESNYSSGSSNLAKCYFNGWGVCKDASKAMEYYKKSLMQDYERGCRSIIADGFDLKSILDEKKFVYDTKECIMTKEDYVLINGCVVVSKKIRCVDPDCFNDTSVKKITVELDNEYYSSIDGALYNKDGTVLIKFPYGRPSNDFIRNEKLKMIEKGAFKDQYSIMHKGKHIAIEGMDGVGKSTTCRMLADRIGFEFIEKPMRYIFDSEGDYGPYLKIRDYVNAQEDRIFTSMFYGLGSVYLYSKFGDRNIITDRHFVSNYMWSGEKSSEPVFKMLIETLGIPDFTVILYADQKTIEKRLKSRDDNDSDLEKLNISEKKYTKANEFFEKYDMPHITINTSTLSTEEICDIIETELRNRGII